MTVKHIRIRICLNVHKSWSSRRNIYLFINKVKLPFPNRTHSFMSVREHTHLFWLSLIVDISCYMVYKFEDTKGVFKSRK